MLEVILIFDEVLSVGDKRFLQKAYQKIQEFLKQKKTLILASHQLKVIQKHCHRILWLAHGKIKQDGHPELIIPQYEKLYRRSKRSKKP